MSSARFCREGLDVAAELETVFEEAQIGDEDFWAGGFDFGDDGLHPFTGDSASDYGGELFDGAHGAGFRNAGGASYAFEVGASARGGGESAGGEETLVVKNKVEEVFWSVAREGA